MSDQGVVGHSIAEAQKRWMILSVDQDPRCLNLFNNFLATEQINHKVVFGMYNRVAEISYVIEQCHMRTILDAGWLNDQESILMLEPMTRFGLFTGSPASLYFIQSGLSEDVGVFTETSIRPEGGTPYTYDAENKRYFTTVPRPSKDVGRLSRFSEAEKARHLEAYKAGRVSSPVLV